MNDSVNNSMAVLVNKHTVRIERLFPGPIERVWDYFTDTQLLSEWLMPGVIGKGLGGLVEFVNPPVPEGLVEGVEWQPNDVYSHGIIKEYNPPKLLAYSWNDATYDSASVFRIELEQQGDQVLVVLIHSHLEPVWMAVTATGWHASLMVLHALLKGEEKPDISETFAQLLIKYKAVVAGAGIVVVVATTASPALAEGLSNEAYQAISAQKHQLLVKYDATWKDAKDIDANIAVLEKATNRDEKALDALHRDLKYKKQDLSAIEADIRDLDRVLLSAH